MTKEQREEIKPFISKIAKKHNVSSRYVRYLLSGERQAKNDKSLSIMEDIGTMLFLTKNILK